LITLIESSEAFPDEVELFEKSPANGRQAKNTSLKMVAVTSYPLTLDGPNSSSNAQANTC